MKVTAALTRNAIFFGLAALFAVLFAAAGALLYLPGPVMLLLGIIFGLAGIILVILTVRLDETGKRKLFFILTGTTAAAIPLAAVLHNFIFDVLLFALALFVFPAFFVIGWMASFILLATTERPVTTPRKQMIGLVIIFVSAAIVALIVPRLEEQSYSVNSEIVNALDQKIDRVFIIAKVEQPLMSVFYHSFEHSLISAFESNGVDAAVKLTSKEAGMPADFGNDVATFAPDATMHISIDPLYRTHMDGHEAIVGTIFEVSLTEATTGARVWHLSGKVDYIAEGFFKDPGYTAHEGIRKEFAWATTAAIVRTFMVDVNGQQSAAIDTVTEERQRHGQRTDQQVKE